MVAFIDSPIVTLLRDSIAPLVLSLTVRHFPGLLKPLEVADPRMCIQFFPCNPSKRSSPASFIQADAFFSFCPFILPQTCAPYPSLVEDPLPFTIRIPFSMDAEMRFPERFPLLWRSFLPLFPPHSIPSGHNFPRFVGIQLRNFFQSLFLSLSLCCCEFAS